MFLRSDHGLTQRRDRRSLRERAADEIAVRLPSAGLSPTRRGRQVLAALEGRRRPVGAHELEYERAG